MEKNIRKKINKKEIVKIFAIYFLSFISFGSLALLIVINSDNSPKYEFYDVNGFWGTSSECGETEKGNLVCLIENNYVPVLQYSKIKKGDDLDVWKK